jgi:hypothetical protein
MQYTQQTNTDSLQGGAQLQQQDVSNSYQQTGGVGQDTQSPQLYQNGQSLSVQGASSSNTKNAVTAGSNTSEAVLLVTVTLLVVGLLFVRKLIARRIITEPQVTVLSESLASPQKTTKYYKKKSKKTSKKSQSKVKKPSKRTKKSSKK